jgi:hypothetical protein
MMDPYPPTIGELAQDGIKKLTQMTRKENMELAGRIRALETLCAALLHRVELLERNHIPDAFD